MTAGLLTATEHAKALSTAPEFYLLSNISSYSITETAGFPEASMRATGTVGSKGSCVIPKDLESNVVWLHQFFFEAEDYVPSDTVKQCSEKIKADTAGAGN